MNHELKRQLKTLADLPGDPGIAAFRVLLRRRAGEQAEQVERRWRNMILTMPEMLERVRREGTALYGFLLTYLYEPRDIMPEEENGFFGFADDAYLVAAAHRRLAGADAVPQAVEWTESFRRFAPLEARRLDALLKGLLEGDTRPYEESLGAPVSDGDERFVKQCDEKSM